MNLFRLPRRTGQRVAIAVVLVILLCGVVVVTLDADRPIPAAPRALAAPPPPLAILAQPLQPADVSPAVPAATTTTTTRRTLVREVDRPDWHQLDGDQLLPAHLHGDNPDILAARRAARLHGATAQAIPPPPPPQQQQQQSFGILAGPRRSWPGEQMRAIAVPSSPLESSPTLPSPPSPQEHRHHVLYRTEHTVEPLHDVSAAPPVTTDAKIALCSLRLVVHLTEDKTPEEEEEEGRRVVPPRGRKLRLDCGAPPPLQVPTNDAQQEQQQQQRRRVAVPEDVTALATMTRQSSTATAAAARVYSDEELRRRCVVANGRAAEPAVLRAMMEGRLRRGCLIIAADVGNDIPTTENNAKGAVAIVSLFISTLFLVFVFIF